MTTPTSIADLPRVPAVYALYGGSGKGRHVAYVGIGESLRRRIQQHLVKRDSSVATGTSAACLNPDLVTEIEWWEQAEFAKDGRLEAAEVVAFEVLNPALRSRGNTPKAAKAALGKPEFVARMQALFASDPTGRLVLPTLETAMRRIADLETRLAKLEERLRG